MSRTAEQVAREVQQGRPAVPAAAPAPAGRESWLGTGGEGTGQGDFEALLGKYDDNFNAFSSLADDDSGPGSSPSPLPERSRGDGGEDGEGDDPDPVQADSDEEEAEPDGPDADDDESAGQDAEDEGLEAAEVAELLGVEESQVAISDDGVLTFNLKVDGQPISATLPDLIRGHQLEQHVTRRSEELGEQRREFAARMEQRDREVARVHQEALATLEAAKGRILTRYDGTDWDKLQAEDPGRFAALQIQMQSEMAALDTEAKGILGQWQQVQQQQQQDLQEGQARWLNEQREALFRHIPEMAAPDTRNPLLQEFHDYLVGYGFSSDEVKGVLDHRMHRVINDAVAYRRAQAKAKAENGGESPDASAAAKQVKRTPKIRRRRAGGARTPQTPEARAGSRKAASLKRLRRSGSDLDAAQFALDSGIVDSLL